MKRAVAVAMAAVGLAAALVSVSASDAPGLPADRATSLAAFAQVASVLMSPRCQNCHTVSTFPTQGDDRHRHTMNVMRGSDGHGAAGLPCTTCHGRSNNAASGVPGADEDWHLAPLGMGWQGLSGHELCQHLKDPGHNGGRTGAGVIEHLGTPLVKWAWAPGTNADGVPRTTPPIGYDAFLAAARTWVAGGQPCPESRS